MSTISGSVLSSIALVVDGEPSSWRAVWTAQASELRSHALAAASAGSRESALWFHLAAADAWDTSNAVTTDDMPADETAVRLGRQSWADFIDLSSRRHLPLEEPELADCYLMRPDGSVSTKPTLLVMPEAPASFSAQWASGGRSAVDRGWNVVLMGPDSPVLACNGLTGALDALAGLPTLQTSAWLGYGLGHGARRLARALVQEQRLAAAALDFGAVEVEGDEQVLIHSRAIRTPLILSASGAYSGAEDLARRMSENLPQPPSLVRLSTTHGPSDHLEPWARGWVENRVLDFLASRVPRMR